MKTLFTFLLFASVILARGQNCFPPSPEKFKAMTARLEQARFDKALLQQASAILDRNCLTTGQVVYIASLFEHDVPRLEFTQRAYGSVVDPQNYYDVFDTFKRFSAAFRLYDFINFPAGGAPNGEVIIIEEPYVEECFTTSDEFTSLKATLQKEPFAMRRLELAKSLIKNRCFRVDQIKVFIGLLSIGSDRVEFAKAAYDNCVDQLEYHRVIDSMTFSTDKDELLKFIQSKQ